MKVAFFIGGLNRGGAETLLLDTFRRRDIHPFDCILIYRNDGELTDAFRATGVPMFRVRPGRLKVGYIHSLRAVLRRENVDILHTQTLLNAFLGLFCVGLSRRRLVATFHGFFFSKTYRLLAHLVIWFADASVFVSGFVREWYIRHTLFACRQKCHVVYNGIDFSKFETQYPVPDFLESAGSASRNADVTLVMVGNFVSGRSQRFICRCIKGIRRSGTENFRFCFIGRRSESEPERYDECVRFCTENGLLDRVLFLGERNDVPAILQHADGFVYSSDHDTFGIAVVEAIAAGVPVIVNDWNVMQEVTDDGRWARLYKTGDEDSCVEAMKELIKNPERFKEEARINSGKVRERFSIERHISRLFDIYSATV